MKAQLITYSYTEHEDDFHKGLKTWQESKKAIIIPELNVLVVEWGRRVHFFEMKGLGGKFELDYYPENYEVELPKKTFEVARTALWLAQNHDRLQAQQTCWKAALTQ